VSSADDPRATTRVASIKRVLSHPVAASIVLILSYFTLTLLNDSAGSLGTDTGTKVATLKVMGERGSLIPDIGYWAAPWDPDAKYHGWLDTRHVDGIYVDVTTLPMLVVDYPLWRLGGQRLALLLPMLGALACAFIARAFVRRIRDGSEGWTAFWLTGLGSPLVVYALDIWEHTLGVACIAGATLLLFDAAERSFRPWHGLAAGALFGAAYSMRTEALVYLVTGFGITGLVLFWRRRFGRAVQLGVTGAISFVAVTAANAALEIALTGESYRFGHSRETAASVGVGVVGEGTRFREAMATSFSPFPSFEPAYLLLGVLLSIALVVLALASDRASRRLVAQAAAAAVILVYLWRVSFGLGFWPGLFAATPLAALGLARGWHNEGRRLVVLLAVVPLPLVFLSQFPGGALPQWSGRYILTSGFLLAVVGAASLADLERWARMAFVGFAVVTSVLGIGWLSTRTHQVANAGDLLNARSEEVLISPEGFPPREFAATYGVKPWLSVHHTSELPAAVEVVRAAGRSTFAIVDQDPSRPLPEFPGFHRTGTSRVPFIDPVELTITSYERDRS